MGDEKPDEELMGKRKSSPRLSTTFSDVDTIRFALLLKNIPTAQFFFACLSYCGTIAENEAFCTRVNGTPSFRTVAFAKKYQTKYKFIYFLMF